MKLVYVGQSDLRTISSRDFPEVTFDFDEDVESVEWVWVPGSILEVPEEVGEFLKLNHRQEFKVYQTDEELEAETAAQEISEAEDDEDLESDPDPSVAELDAMSRDELIELAEREELTFRPKAKKTELVELLVQHFDSPDDESLDDDSVDPDSNPESPEE